MGNTKSVQCHSERRAVLKEESGQSCRQSRPGEGAGVCAQEQCYGQNRSVLQPLVLSWCSLLPTPSFLPSFQIFTIKEENNRLRQEKQILKNKLEELKNKALWNNPMMVTECAWALESAGKGTSLAGEKLQLSAAGHCVMTGTAPASRWLL